MENMNKPMNKIEKLIADLCPEGVEFKELGGIVNILDNQRQPVTKSKRISGIMPYYGANGIQDYVQDYIFDGVFLLMGEDGSVINKDGSPVLNWAVGKIWVNNHAHIMSEVPDIALLRFVYFYLQTVDVTPIVRGTPPKINQQNLRSIPIPIPPLAIQQEIVKILDTFTELEARKKQYEYYREELLTFEDDVEWKALGEITASIASGRNKSRSTIGDYPVCGSTGQLGYCDQPSYSGETLLVARVGANAGLVNMVCGEFDVSDNTLIVRPHAEWDIRFAFHQLTQMNLNQYAVGGGQPLVTGGLLKSLKVCLPPLSEQARIANILDKFDSLVNDISAGLPAELNARRKQYEYYRDKLLTFKRKV